jgi:hypothetical protein
MPSYHHIVTASLLRSAAGFHCHITHHLGSHASDSRSLKVRSYKIFTMDVSEAPQNFVFTSSTTAAIIILFGLTSLAILTIYRLCFSPIAHFPGPKLAAATFWYEFYYDVILGGQYYFKIKRLHEQYGSPVIRINPKELHVLTPSFADELYAGATRNRDKWAYKTKALGVVNSTFTTDPHDLHRLRRSALSPFFAKGVVRGLQPLIDAKIAQLLNRLDGARKTGRIITFNHALAAFTNGK